MKTIILLLLSLNILAAIPTMEGLFRNPSNPDLEEDLAVLVAKVTIEALEIADTSTDQYKEERYLKVLFENTDEGLKRIIVAQYPTRELVNANVKSITVIKKLDELVGQDHNKIRQLIFSALAMYSANESTAMANLLKSLSPDFIRNEETLNEEKKELLKKYAQYLIQKNEKEKKEKEEAKKNKDIKVQAQVEETEEDKLNSPLTPEEEEEKLRVNEIIKSSMYAKTESIKLKKEGKNFFWFLTLENVSAKFTNEGHNLKHLKLIDNEGEIEFIPNKLVTYSGKYIMPKSFEIRTLKDRITLEVENYYTINSKKKTFAQRIQDYKDLKAKIIKKPEEAKQTEEVSEDVAQLLKPSIKIEQILY